MGFKFPKLLVVTTCCGRPRQDLQESSETRVHLQPEVQYQPFSVLLDIGNRKACRQVVDRTRTELKPKGSINTVQLHVWIWRVTSVAAAAAGAPAAASNRLVDMCLCEW